MRAFLAAILLCLCQLDAADYYISTSGNDTTGDGSIGNRWRTFSKVAGVGATFINPGDTIHVADGFYNEAVEFHQGGESGSPVTYVAEGSNARFRQARIRDPYIILDGFKIFGANQMSWLSHVRFENDADFCELHDITIGPGAYVMADDWSINGAANTITSPSVDFVSAGFAAGMQFYIGASGIPGLYPDNHDTVHTISSVATNTLTTSTDLVTESLDPFWAPVFVGPDRNGIGGILFVVTSSLWANNCVLDGVTISDIWGEGMNINGTDHEILNCVVTNNHTYPALKPFGSNQYIHHNLFYNCPNILFYTSDEGTLLTHPAGAGWYDYQAGFVHSSTGGTGGGLDNRIEYNWFENVHNALGQISESTTSNGFDMRNNVFVGIAGTGAGGRNGLEWTNNTFYRVAHRYPDVHAFVGGGNTPAKPQLGLVITENVFVDNGSHWKTDEGFYAITPNTTTPIIDENFVAGPETSGFAARGNFSETNGINGGDPVFINPSDPLGPDNLPFTADDGLRPLPSSPFAASGWGALEPVEVVVGEPFAHFCVTNLSGGLGWKDEASYDFDPAWLALEPFERTAPVRPYTTPEALGFAPVDVEFSAAKSVGGLTSESVDPTGITDFEWDFGDGSAIVNTAAQTVQHTFEFAGTYTVSLTVTNSAAGTDTYEMTYRALGDPPPPPSGDAYHLARTGNDTTGDGSFANPWKTIQKAMNSVAPGDTVLCGAGNYTEAIEMAAVADGTDEARITFDGQGVAQISARLEVKQSYWTFQNFLFKGHSQAQTPAEFIKIANFANNGELLNNVIDMDFTLNHSAVSFSSNLKAGDFAFNSDWPANWLVSGNEIKNGKGQAMFVICGFNNVIAGNTSHDHISCDFYRIFGDGNIVRGNRDYNNLAATPEDPVGYHPDWMQTFGNNGTGSRNHIIERNLTFDCESQIFQLVEGTAAQPALIGTGSVGAWMVRNNIFVHYTLGMSNTIPDMEFYNNIFYRVATTGGTPIGAGESDRGSSDGIIVKNNAFFECGADPSRNNIGWYFYNTAVTGTYDYNYVAGLGGAPKRTSGPQRAFYFEEAHGVNGGLPGWVDRAALNFKLNTDSILRDVADDLSGIFTTDYLGATRTAWDIGAIEFDGTFNPPDDPPPPPQTPPDAPTDLAAVAVSAHRIDLTWTDNSETEQGFRVYRSTTSGSGYQLIRTTSGSVEAEPSIGLTPGTVYYYIVVAFNAEGESSASNEATATTFLPAPQRFRNRGANVGSLGNTGVLGF